MVYGHASGETIDEAVAVGARTTSSSATARCGRSARCPASSYTYGIGKGGQVRARRRRAADGIDVEHRAVPGHRGAAVRAAAPGVRAERPPAARRPPPADADRGGAAGPAARAVPPVLDGGPDAGRAPGGLPADPPAHDHADRGRRGLQLDLRLPAADPGAVDRLHPHHGGARRRHQPPAEDRGTGRAAPGAHGLARRDGPQPGLPRRGAALRPQRAQLRHPGVHAARRRTPIACSRTRTRSRAGTCTPATRRGSASTWTRPWPRRFPYRQAYLPVARLEDGTVHSW